MVEFCHKPSDYMSQALMIPEFSKSENKSYYCTCQSSYDESSCVSQKGMFFFLFQ